MVKKRLIFTLLLEAGVIQLSRNFSLQAVGDLKWLHDSYDFDLLAKSIDELVLLNVGRTSKDIEVFSNAVSNIGRCTFMPIAAGGGIQSIDDAYRILDAGADKLVVNTAIFHNPKLIVALVRIFGSQCIVASIDYKGSPGNNQVFTKNGTQATGLSVEEAVKTIEGYGVGEVYLTSIEKDGTGQGYDIDMLRRVVQLCRVPVIASGGVGDYEHFVAGMQISNITGTSTANIFNFVGDGLAEARKHISESIELATWDFLSLASAPARPEPYEGY